jgi:arsenical pump membrane protein
MALALGSYPLLSYAGGPVWCVAASAAAAGTALCWYHRIASPDELRTTISWDILVFLFCVFVIVIGLRNVGLVDQITDLYASALGPTAKIWLIGISSAVGSAVLNNHPMAIINALAISRLPEPTDQLMLAALIGGDLGPRLLPMGSLAGLLWLDLLRKQGIHITVLQFIVVGLLVTLPALIFSLLLLIAMGV